MPRSPSRRKLEEDITMLIQEHSFYRVIHALVELCHARTAGTFDEIQEQRWRFMCAMLSVAEQRADEYHL